MPVLTTDIELRLSGGTANTSPAAALGGALSTAGGGAITTAVKNNVFDDVTAAESAAGDVEYRGLYAKNNNGSASTLADARIYHSADSSNAGDILDIALASEAINTAIATIANESTAPVGPTFSHPTTYAGGLQLNSTTGLAAQDYKGFWVRRTISAGASSGSITNNLKVEGTTV